MAEDMLTELYAWDSEIEDVSALAADDPKRDEDKAEDAYEQIIHAATGADASDVVLSLAAQLLHKHFFRFPHVQMNVVDVLLKLCGPKRSQAVRIHTLRALLQIVKTPPAAAAASTPTSGASIARKNTRMWMQRIDETVQHMLESEKSSVILRQVTPLRQALEERLQPELDLIKSNHAAINDQSVNNLTSSPSERSRKKPRDEKNVAGGDDGFASSEREPKKAKHDDGFGKIVQLNRDASNDGTPRGSNDDSSLWNKQLSSSRTVESEGRRQKVNAFSPRNCPPCPYLFLGSVPRHTPSADIVEFLSAVWPEIDNTSVQIKQPDYNATAYAFVSMPTIEHAREAILYVNANKFRGRAFLNANFARGPPVDTILFVERTGEDVNMEDKDAVREFDFTKCDPEVWDGMCQQLERFGPLSFAEKGCVRFRSVEHAKAAIRKQLFSVKGYEIFPVYDTKEQFTIDSTRRGSNLHAKQGFALKSGRLVGGDADYRNSKNHHYREDDDPMDSSNGHRGYGTVSDKENRREFRSRYGRRSPYADGLVDVTVLGWSRIQSKTRESVANCVRKAEAAETFTEAVLRLRPPRRGVVAKMKDAQVITNVEGLLKMVVSLIDAMNLYRKSVVDEVEVAVVVIGITRNSLTEVEGVAECIARSWVVPVPPSRLLLTIARLPRNSIANPTVVNVVGSLHRAVERPDIHRRRRRCFRMLSEIATSLTRRLMTVNPVVTSVATTRTMIEVEKTKATAATVTVSISSNGASPRRSFSRRNEGDGQAEEAAVKDKQPRSKTEDDSEPQQKEMKNGGARLARDELFAGMDDLTVDYEEDDE
ncbi:hypothetical protein JG688_00002955 [Phytophthora aleatoria]|uniref:RRM domain-containing protein n=1 Tax=Phytophthora aleatoria TaxID=2496075 RepID=A0A8J5JBS2_9STRA|nr:hypothetical protein JG688_00002955 [Phytophthora aleatoria]